MPIREDRSELDRYAHVYTDSDGHGDMASQTTCNNWHSTHGFCRSHEFQQFQGTLNQTKDADPLLLPVPKGSVHWLEGTATNQKDPGQKHVDGFASFS